MILHRLILPVFLIMPILFCASCNDESTEITSRELSNGEGDLKIVKTSAERFRMSGRKASAAAAPSKTGSGSGEPKLVHKTPEGWKDVPGSQMRFINLTFGKDGKGECYLTRLPGAGGGLMANVNRWRKQMGADPLTAEGIAALPKRKLFGEDASLIDVTGNFGGMSGTAGKKDYRLLGLIFSNSSGAVFVKMIGPKADVDANAAKFDEFTSSLDLSIQ